MHLRKLIQSTSWLLMVSCGMNLVLAASLALVWRANPEPALNQPPPTVVTAAKPTRPEGTVPAAKPSPFHWRQLDAVDFPTFVGNLRSIGCPEATIRDIVQGELHEIYTFKQQEVERELAAATPGSRPALQQRLQQLKTEEASVLTLALGSGAAATGAIAQTSPSSSPASGTQAAAATGAAVKNSGATLTPVAFLVGNDPTQPAATSSLSATPTDPRLNQAAAAVLGQVRQDFATSLQSAGSDPTSPVYRQRWLSAQRASDEQFSSMFGGDYFIQAQLEAVRNATNAKP